MSQKNLRIITYGNVITGFDQSIVETKLIQLCKFPPDKVARLFTGKKVIIKSGLNSESAKRYLTVLTETGLSCEVESVPVTATRYEQSAETPQRPQATSSKQPPSRLPRQQQSPFVVGRSFVLICAFVLLVIVGISGYYFKQPFSLMLTATAGGFKYVKPPSTLQSKEPVAQLSGAEIENFYELLENRQFAILNAKLEEIMSTSERDPNLDYKKHQVFNLFSQPLLAHRKATFDKWVEQYPDNYASHLGRALFFFGHGCRARGGKWASETSREQFDQMHYYYDLAIVDYTTALRLKPDLFPAYIGLIKIYNGKGDNVQQDKMIHQAQQLFPASYQLYKYILNATLPRWGGSYAEMTRYAQQANKHIAEDRKMPQLFGKVHCDMAWYANDDKDYKKALKLYNQALVYGAYDGILEDRAQVYLKLGETDKAIADLQRAMELNPEYTSLYTELADIYFDQGDYDKALATVERAHKVSFWRDYTLNCWYGHKIWTLHYNRKGAIHNYIDSANGFLNARETKAFPAGRSLKRLDFRQRFRAPYGTTPYGLAWHQGALYLSSYENSPGLYQLNPDNGRVVNFSVPDIVKDNRYGGLASDGDKLFHIPAYFNRNMQELDTEKLDSVEKTYLHTSQFHFSDFTFHDRSIYVIGYHLASKIKDYRLLKFTPNGHLLAAFQITPIKNKSMSCGMTSDGTSLWVSMGAVLYKIDPNSGDVIDGFRLPGETHCLAWDGKQLWGATREGRVFTASI